MLRRVRTIAALCLGLLAPLAVAASAVAEPLGLQDVAALKADAKDNAVNFKEKYGGKTFVATLPYVSASSTRSGLSVFFGRGKDWQEVSCLRILDPDVFAQIESWERGAIVTITGSVLDYWVGLNLLDCTFTE